MLRGVSPWVIKKDPRGGNVGMLSRRLKHQNRIRLSPLNWQKLTAGSFGARNILVRILNTRYPIRTGAIGYVKCVLSKPNFTMAFKWVIFTRLTNNAPLSMIPKKIAMSHGLDRHKVDPCFMTPPPVMHQENPFRGGCLSSNRTLLINKLGVGVV